MDNTQKHLIGKRISFIRDKHNKTLEEFGKIIDNATKSNVSKWEKGEVLPNRKRLKMIADFDGTTVEYLLTGHEVRDLAGNIMPEGFRLFDYEIIGHHEQKIEDSPAVFIHSFIKISKDDIFYYGGIRSYIVLGNIDISSRNASITILSESLEENEFYTAASSSDLNFNHDTTGIVPFVNCDNYLSSVKMRDKNFRSTFLNNLLDGLLNTLKQGKEIPFEDVDFKGTFNYFKRDLTERVLLNIGE